MPGRGRRRPVLVGPADPVQSGRAAGHRRRLPRLGARQQSDPQGRALRSTANRRAERPHRRPVQYRAWPMDGRILPAAGGHRGCGHRRLPGLRRQSRPVRARPASSRDGADRRLFPRGALLRCRRRGHCAG